MQEWVSNIFAKGSERYTGLQIDGESEVTAPGRDPLTRLLNVKYYYFQI
jgi:hypothetical protein